MLQTNRKPGVFECAATGCGYYSNRACHAIAIIITIDDGHPRCDTFFKPPILGSMSETAEADASGFSFRCHA